MSQEHLPFHYQKNILESNETPLIPFHPHDTFEDTLPERQEAAEISFDQIVSPRPTYTISWSNSISGTIYSHQGELASVRTTHYHPLLAWPLLTGLDENRFHAEALSSPLHDFAQIDDAGRHNGAVASMPNYGVPEYLMQPTARLVSATKSDGDRVNSTSRPTFLQLSSAHLGSQIPRPKRRPESSFARLQDSRFGENGTNYMTLPTSMFTHIVSLFLTFFIPDPALHDIARPQLQMQDDSLMQSLHDTTMTEVVSLNGHSQQHVLPQPVWFALSSQGQSTPLGRYRDPLSQPQCSFYNFETFNVPFTPFLENIQEGSVDYVGGDSVTHASTPAFSIEGL